jgi:RNA polymerase sigma factor (sigma-70 family)
MQPATISSAAAVLEKALRDAAPDAVITHLSGFLPFHTNLLHGFLRRYCLSEEEILDVARQCPAIRSENRLAGMAAWLSAVVKGKAISLLRRQERRRTRTFTALGSAAPDVADLADNPEKLYDAHWRDQRVREVAQELREHVDEISHRIFIMRALDERSVAEVALAFGLTEPAVCARHHRALEKFKVLFKHLAGDAYEILREEYS